MLEMEMTADVDVNVDEIESSGIVGSGSLCFVLKSDDFVFVVVSLSSSC